jgi:hypothetical protein
MIRDLVTPEREGPVISCEIREDDKNTSYCLIAASFLKKSLIGATSGSNIIDPPSQDKRICVVAASGYEKYF